MIAVHRRVALMLVAALCASMLASTARAQRNPRTLHLSGRIADQPVRMQLTRSGNHLYGAYFYEKHWKRIPLNGMIAPTGRFIVQESECLDCGKPVLTGRLSNGRIEGVWTSGDRAHAFAAHHARPIAKVHPGWRRIVDEKTGLAVALPRTWSRNDTTEGIIVKRPQPTPPEDPFNDREPPVYADSALTMLVRFGPSTDVMPFLEEAIGLTWAQIRRGKTITSAAVTSRSPTSITLEGRVCPNSMARAAYIHCTLTVSVHQDGWVTVQSDTFMRNENAMVAATLHRAPDE